MSKIRLWWTVPASAAARLAPPPKNVLRDHNAAHHTYPNQSDRYANHQLATPIGIVAASAHHSGNAISAAIPSSANVAQKIFFCTPSF
jgi:hypothetical protein